MVWKNDNYGQRISRDAFEHLFNIEPSKYEPFHSLKSESVGKEIPFATVEVAYKCFVWFSSDGITVNIRCAKLSLEYFCDDEDNPNPVLSVAIIGRYPERMGGVSGIDYLKGLACFIAKMAASAYGRTSGFNLLPDGIKLVEDDYYGNDL